MVSFQGQRKAPEKREAQQILVKDCMTKKLVTFRPEQTMDEVMQTLLKKNISGGPVVDEHNNIVGMISEGDCLKDSLRGKYNNTMSQSHLLKDRMITDVKTIDPDTEVMEAARMHLEMKLRRFPVMKDGKLLGQISQRDVMRAVQKLRNQTW